LLRRLRDDVISCSFETVSDSNQLLSPLASLAAEDQLDDGVELLPIRCACKVRVQFDEYGSELVECLMGKLINSPNGRMLVTIIERRFGIHGEPAATLEELGLDYGLTRERIRQLEVRAIERLQKWYRQLFDVDSGKPKQQLTEIPWTQIIAALEPRQKPSAPPRRPDYSNKRWNTNRTSFSLPERQQEMRQRLRHRKRD
jgi:hypothetical protein